MASNAPLATVYPESNKEVCRLINYCHKYNFRLLVADSQEPLLPGDYTGVITVHLDRMQTHHLDTDNSCVSVGAGMTLDQVNTLLAPHGLCVPVPEEYGHYQVHQAVSNNLVPLLTANLVNFNQVVRSMQVSLVNKVSGEQLLTSPNPFYVFGPQSNHNEMFVGKNHINGIISEVTL